MKGTLFVIVFANIFFFAMAALAATIRVPADFPTIQAGIDAAAPGDVVLVAAGTYHDCTHTVTGLPHPFCVVMKSGVALVSESGAEMTVIDAQRLGAVILADSLASGTRLEGFTITGGKTANPYYGAGIRCRYSQAEFVDNIIVDNETTGNGGGVYLSRGANTFTRNTVLNNRANSYYGGGLYCIASATTFSHCIFKGNSATTGGGIVTDFSYDGLHPKFDRCEITDNHASGAGGGIWSSNASKPFFINCTVAGNTCNNGSAFYCQVSTVKASFSRCIFAFNSGSSTFVCNTNSIFECCDIFGNTGGDVICGTDGGNNFSLDPLFCGPPGSGCYQINPGSPCGNAPNCGQVGAYPDVTAVEETSWGKIKAMYR